METTKVKMAEQTTADNAKQMTWSDLVEKRSSSTVDRVSFSVTVPDEVIFRLARLDPVYVFERDDAGKAHRTDEIATDDEGRAAFTIELLFGSANGGMSRRAYLTKDQYRHLAELVGEQVRVVGLRIEPHFRNTSRTGSNFVSRQFETYYDWDVLERA